MKKVFKNPFFMFILGAVICGSVGVIANGLTAKEIEFESNENWEANTVEQALNDLYALKIPSNYSTDEKIVGKWIDGKPIYQKTISISSVTIANNNYTSFEILSNVAHLVYAYPMVYYKNGSNQTYNLNEAIASAGGTAYSNIRFDHNRDNKTVNITIVNRLGYQITTQDGSYVTVQYIKNN